MHETLDATLNAAHSAASQPNSSSCVVAPCASLGVKTAGNGPANVSRGGSKRGPLIRVHRPAENGRLIKPADLETGSLL